MSDLPFAELLKVAHCAATCARAAEGDCPGPCPDVLDSALKRFTHEHPESVFVEYLREEGLNETVIEVVLQCLEKVCTKCFEDRPEGPCYCDYSS